MRDFKQEWVTYCEAELAALEPVLERHGITLAAEQPHLKGERYLQQAVTTKSGKKLILYGQKDGARVVIKATREAAGEAELKHERVCRQLLHEIDFAAEAFATPPELLWFEESGFLVSVQQFIEQPRTFLEHTLPEQFDLALRSFVAQEGTHAATYGHIKKIKRVYEIRSAENYLRNLEDFASSVKTLLPEHTEVHGLLDDARKVLNKKSQTIEQYCGFLTHTDFVPHNLRVSADGTIYLLDHSSLTFGNKHEGWARFLNFMTLYHPALAKTLTQYVADNRAAEENESLWLMRLYRLSELIFYYAKAQASSTEDLQELNQRRVDFWAQVLSHRLKQEAVPSDVVESYKIDRDRLRSSDEKKRQEGLH